MRNFPELWPPDCIHPNAMRKLLSRLQIGLIWLLMVLTVASPFSASAATAAEIFGRCRDLLLGIFHSSKISIQPDDPSSAIGTDSPTRIETAQKNIHTSVRRLLEENQLSYDNYFEVIIQSVTPETLPIMLRALIGDYSNDATESETWRIVNQKIATVQREVGVRYTSLLMDPGIAFRIDKFVEFSRSMQLAKSEISPLELRRNFISTFEKKYFYRATLTKQAGPMIARAFSAAKQNPADLDKNIESWMRSRLELFGNKSDGEYLLSNLPILGSFYQTVIYHVMDARSESGVISVSEHPQIAWYAVADNGSKFWLNERRRFRDGVYIHRISMNSFYALSRNIVLDNFRDAQGDYEIEQGESVFRLAVNDPSAELLVSVAVPGTWEVRRYVPRYPFFGAASFQIPKPADWE